MEKNVVLDVGLRLAKLLERETGDEVILTRKDDTFIPLEERTALANQKGADLFISIHANASPDRSARGLEYAVALEERLETTRTQGTIPAPETSHAIRAVVDEALAAKEEGVERVILFNYSGHGLLDLQAYDDYLHDRLDA